ncbi:MAG: GtrA family protein [Pseudomonadota bacterium]
MIRSIILDKTDNVKIQLLRSLVVGALASIIDILSFAILTEVFEIYYLLANICSFLIGLLVNYSLTIKWVFTTTKGKKRSHEFVQFSLVGVVGLIINQLVLWFCTDFLAVYVLLSKVIATLVAFVWNFFARRYFVF